MKTNTDVFRNGARVSGYMPTLVRDPAPVEFQALLKQRRRLGQDLLDEVWEGVYHMNPAPAGRHARIVQQLALLLDEPAREAGLVAMISIFNLGEPGDFRVPDGGVHRDPTDRVYYPTVALVVEVVSPDDDTWKKRGFYAAHGVDELLIADPQERRVHWLALTPTGEYRPVERSGLIQLAPGELAGRLDWPT